jgi:transcription elongation factor GreA-like protein
MGIKVGNIVSHTGALEWGAGKVMEITANSAMIQFSDGKNRKIAVSHFTTLQPAAPNSFLPPPEVLVEAKAARATRGAKAAKKKL